MKKYVFFALLLAANSAFAQQVTVTEPEFINSFSLLTSDSTLATLPKENGTIGQHSSKTKKLAKWAGKVASAVGAAGMIGMHTSVRTGNLSGLSKSLNMTTTAWDVENAASAVSGLAGSDGMDIIFSGGSSSFSVPASGDIRILVKAEKNDADPADIYRIVRFSASKKERRIQWMEFSANLIGSAEVKKGGYVSFAGKKYGVSSYILTIPTSEVTPGEYGIFYTSIISATTIPVGTFSVK